MGVLKHFACQEIFWSEGVETFLDKNCLIFLIKTFKSIYHKNYTERFDIVQNLYKFQAHSVSIPQEAKCFNTPMSYTTDAYLYNPSVKIGSISFFFFFIFRYGKFQPSFRMPRYWHKFFTYLFQSTLRSTNLTCLTKKLF